MAKSAEKMSEFVTRKKNVRVRGEGSLELFDVFEEVRTFRRNYTIPFNTLVVVLEDGDSDESTVENLLTHEVRSRRKNDLYFTPVRLPVFYTSTANLHFIAIHFNLFRYPGMDVYEGQKEWIFEKDPVMVRRIRDAFALPDRLQSLTALKACCLDFCAAHWPPPPRTGDPEEMAVFLPVMESIRGGVSASVTVADLAARLRMRPDQFARKFTALFGKPPKEFLQSELAARAAALLLKPGIRVKEAASVLGFSDEYCFSKFFKRRIGCSPSEYRKLPLNAPK